jgi:chemotaxis protein histidine kinase CheA
LIRHDQPEHAMDGENEDRLEAELRALRAEYLAEAPERVRELSAALGRLRTRDLSALADLRLYFHRLAGSGGSYGFPEITSRSRAAELAVGALISGGRPLERADFVTLEQHVLAVAEVFRNAHPASGAEPPG